MLTVVNHQQQLLVTQVCEQKGQRIGRNPKTGQEVPILPRKVLVFRASHVLKGKINRALTKAKPAAGTGTPSPPDTTTPPPAATP